MHFILWCFIEAILTGTCLATSSPPFSLTRFKLNKDFVIYRQVSYIRRTLEDNEIVYHSDVVGASPVGAAPTTSSFST